MDTQTEIEQLIGKQAPPIQEIAQTVRRYLLTALPELEEDVSSKLSIIYFKHDGVVCALSLHKAHANLHFYKGTLLSDPEGILQGSGGKLRHIRFNSTADINLDVLESYVREAYALNAA